MSGMQRPFKGTAALHLRVETTAILSELSHVYLIWADIEEIGDPLNHALQVLTF